MPTIGVDWGNSVNLFNSGATLGSALAGAVGGGMKRQLLEDQHAKNLAYIDTLQGKQRLQDQEYHGREDAARYASDLERARHGATNASPAGGRAPAPVDITAASSGYAGAIQRFASNATDAAQGLGRASGAAGMMFGPQDDMRKNFALYGGNPTNNTLLGPGDTAGTSAQIQIGNAREAAKAQGDIAVQAAGVPGKIQIEQVKTQGDIQRDAAKVGLDQQVDPMKNPDSIVYQLETKKYHQGGVLSPEEEAQLRLAKEKAFPRRDISFEDKGTGEHVVVPNAVGGAPDIYGPAPVAPIRAAPGGGATPRAPTPAPIGGAIPAPTPGSQIPPPGTPAIVGGQPQQNPNELRFGSAKPTAAPTDAQGKAYKYARSKIDAEATLQQYSDPTQIPPNIDGAIRAMQNGSMTAQQAWDTLPDENSRAWFDAAYLFLTGVMRDESGAAIGPAEFAQRYPTIFPTANSSPAEIARKTMLRKSIIAGDFSMLPQHLQGELDSHAKRSSVLFHDNDVPFVQPYKPRAPMQAHPDDDIVEITPVGP
jgi:hypothetical protein